MITYVLVTILLAIIQTILAPFTLLSNATLPADISSAISNAGIYIAVANEAVPILSLLSIITLAVLIKNTKFGFRILMWLKELVW